MLRRVLFTFSVEALIALLHDVTLHNSVMDASELGQVEAFPSLYHCKAPFPLTSPS